MDTIRRTPDTAFDWRTLLHPASAYGHPDEVLADPDLTTAEKRAILSSWASDACAVDDAPGLRQSPGAETAVLFDDIVEALHLLDGEEPTPPRPGGKGARKPPWQRDRDGEGGMPQAA
ncbi:MAG TPA: hypothetical protein VHD59_15245 [Pseudolabrys sp.]|jgi:hypothetical protein|nr:hypothetical protein [Pseudolabrys sp.]